MLRDAEFLKDKNKCIKNKINSNNDTFNCEFSEMFVNNFHISVELNDDLDPAVLDDAAEAQLTKYCHNVLDFQFYSGSEEIYDVHDQVNKFIINNITQMGDGRLQVSLPWKGKVAHNLPNNYCLAKKILYTNLIRYNKNECKLMMMNNVIKGQLQTGII